MMRTRLSYFQYLVEERDLFYASGGDGGYADM